MAEDGKYVDGSLWFYAPNKGAPVFFAVAFAASGAYHAYQCRKYKSWRLTGLYAFCGVVFTAGFAMREVGAFNYESLPVLLASVCLTYAAPPLYELANYIVLGRILYYVPYHSPVHPGRVLTTFGALSAIVEGLNGWGVSYATNRSLSQRMQDIGHNLLKASLLLQLVIITCFLTLLTYFLHQCRKAGIRNSKLLQSSITLYISSGIITVRTIYRTVEYFGLAELRFDGSTDPNTLSPLIRYEWFFYVFEASLMLVNSALLNFRHPRHFLPQSTKVYLAQDGETEALGPGYKEERNFVSTLLDPFDIYGLIIGRDKKTKFWEAHADDAVAAPTKDGSHNSPA